MVFSSNIFLFAFLPLFLVCYYLTPSRARSALILIFSYAFYAWWRPEFLALLLGVTGVSYGIALAKVSHEIRDSNGPMLVAAVAEHGFGSAAWVCVPDDRAKLLVELRQALDGSDVVLVTGGVSVGKYDLVPSSNVRYLRPSPSV